MIGLSDGTSLNVDFGDFSADAVAPTGQTTAAEENASLQFTDITSGQDFQGLTVQFSHNGALSAGGENYSLSGSGDSQVLTIEINDTLTTASDVANLINTDPTLSSQLSVTAVEDGGGSPGTGLVSAADTATLSGSPALAATSDPTIGDVINFLNSLSPSKVFASFTDEGIVVTDLTSGEESFTISNATNDTEGTESIESLTASDLGLVGSTTSSSIVAPYESQPLRGASLDSLAGGTGIGPLTSLDITLSDGSSASVDLSSASNTNEIVDALNASGLSLIATLNDARNGFRIRDVSGGTGNLQISSADDTAAQLKLEADTEDSIVVGGNLGRQTITNRTRLADLNQGSGVNGGSFTISDSNGNTSAINITTDKITTVGELIDRFNDLGIGISASLNETGDGIAIVDTAGGTQELKISDTGNGTAAADLGIAGTATEQTFGGATVSALIGTQADVIEIQADDTLQDIVTAINDSGRYGDASVVTNDDGTYSLRIRSKSGGEAGRLAINTNGFDLNLKTESRGQDAIITLSADGGTNRFLTSSDGVFEDEATGLNLTLKSLSEDPITVSVAENPDAVTNAAQSFVDQYNNLVDKLDSLTFFNADTNEVGLLFGTSEALRIETGYTRLLSGTVRTGSTLRSLGEVGIRFNDQGKLSLDKSKLESAISKDAEAVEKFFINVDPETDVDSGLGKKLSDLADRLAGTDGGLLLNRTNTINDQIERSNSRVEALNDRLDSERERLLRQFIAAEEAIARIQTNQSAIAQIQPITIPT